MTDLPTSAGCKGPDVVRTILRGGKPFTYLHYICDMGDVVVLRNLLSLDASSIDEPALHETTTYTRPIHWARSPEIAEILIAGGARVGKLPEETWSPLAMALRRGLTDVADKLVEVDPSIVEPAMTTPSGEHLVESLIRLLVQVHPSAELPGVPGLLNSIAWAAKQDCVDLVKVDQYSKKNLLDVAARYSSTARRLLLQMESAKAERDGTELRIATQCLPCTEYDSDSSICSTEKPFPRGPAALRLLLAQIRDMKRSNDIARHYTAWRDNAKDGDETWPVRRRGTPMESPDKLLALHWAITAVDIDAVHTLLMDEAIASRVNERIPDAVSKSMVYYPCGKVYAGKNAIELAIERNVQWPRSESDEATSEDYHNDSEEYTTKRQIINLLFEAGADVNCALAHAIRRGVYPALIRALVARGARFTNENDTRRRTPLGALLSSQMMFGIVTVIVKVITEELDPVDIERVTETRQNGKQESVMDTCIRRYDADPYYNAHIIQPLRAYQARFIATVSLK